MKLAAVGIALLPAVALSWLFYQSRVANPRVVLELRQRPDGERASRVMLVTLPSGRTIPVNYLREADKVYAGADGRWWRELRGGGATVELLVRGEILRGNAVAIENDPEHRASVFARLRPSALSWAGTLVEITLLDEQEGSRA